MLVFIPHCMRRMVTEHGKVRWRPLGDSALITICDDPAEFARQLRVQKPEVCCDVVSSYHHLAVYFQPTDCAEIKHWLAHFSFKNHEHPPRVHRIPVWYHPKWLADLAAQLKRSPAEVLALHSSTTFKVAALGFSPGFPYLTGLPDELHLPRKATPARLPAGTVAIAAQQAGIYPNDSFGGWHPLGLTDVPLFDPRQEPHTLLEPGDQVSFEALDEKPSPPTYSKSPSQSGAAVATVEAAGPATSIQSPGRAGYRHLGVTPGGSSDPEMVAALNLLLGNPRHAASLEFALEAPVLRFLQPCQIAFLGPHHPRSGRVIKLKKNELLDLRSCPMQSSFGTLAITGGFAADEILGSAATDIRGQFGGQFLQAGDSLFQEGHLSGTPPSKSVLCWPLLFSNSLTVRVIEGEQADWFSDHLEEMTFHKSARFDRTAARLTGDPLAQKITQDLTSRPLLAGAIQVPPDGTPTVLLPECQTIGGYPVIAHVIAADLPAFARARPGTTLRFQKVTLAEARRAYEIAQRELAILHTGLTFAP